MITLRKAGERGHADHGWLDSWHSFSFADYHDPAHMGVGNLRVINDDRIAPGTGFGTHGHRDMEIVSYVLDGALAHQDSMGNGRDGGVIRPGDVQRMSAGTGVLHSEFNHSKDQVTHFLQIWILPRHRGIEPGYEQRHFAADTRRGTLRCIAVPEGDPRAADALTIHADAAIRAGLFDGDESVDEALPAGRLTYVHVARGAVRVNGQSLGAGDALTLHDEPRLHIDQGQQAEVLVFDLAPL